MKASSRIEMYRLIGLDIWHFFTPLNYVGEQRYFKGEKADFWGITQEAYLNGDSNHLCPLSDVSSVDEVERYQWPDIADFDASYFEKQIGLYNEFAIDGGLWAPIFHNATWLCGFENTLINLKLEPAISKAILRHVTDFWIEYLKKLMEAGKGRIDLVQNCNDFGTQRGMITSVQTFREFFKPELKRIYDVIKSYNAMVMQHSCGAIEPIIPDLIEIGMDILNPVQVSAAGMDMENLAGRYGTQITFYGGIDTQHVLPDAPPEIIRAEVRRAIRTLGFGGGYILSPSQAYESDIPFDHLMAMFDAGKSFIDI